MTHALIRILPALACIAAVTFASGALAEDCFADYKAKQNDPLRLHYGVAEISGSCTASQAQQELSPRLAPDGWVLLNVLSVFDASGLDSRKADAGQFYLRY
ncbi:hypothetical protein N6L24_06375 [Cognatishimia sp. SS12]|uniref:hypothetical protein n=1 Tax=Cognatishimia sp. SS12 TaxID=2979465 RepID=UPI00232EE6FC|nr:hypothetical protein [Cognatishimia sp. SS12]MDC0737896.1 hypothetical protein [Cognatishimia sp. SS12]